MCSFLLFYMDIRLLYCRLTYIASFKAGYGVGIVGKCLGPTTSKGLRKTAAKYSEHTLANQSITFYVL